MKNGFGLALIGLCIATSAPAAEFKFVALGDLPYGPPAKVYPPFERLIAEINAKAPAFTVHIGDTKSGSTPHGNRLKFRCFLRGFVCDSLISEIIFGDRHALIEPT